MVLGLGTDIIEVERINKSIDNDLFIKKIFSPNEILYCEGMVNKAQHYAARFAAKEAFAKALGTGFRGDIALTEIEILNDALGKPYLNPSEKTQHILNQKNIKHLHLTLSHIKETAMAVVILEG